MTRSIAIAAVIFSALILTLSSCSKKETSSTKPITQNPQGGITPEATCTLTFNDTIHRSADSIRWDYNSSQPRMQAFIRDTAVFTLWPGTITSGTRALSYRYLYWIIYPQSIYSVNSTGGTVTISNNNDTLSGSLSAHGDIYNGTGPAPTKIEATFSNVRQYGH